MSRAAFFYSDLTDAVEHVIAECQSNGHDPHTFFTQAAKLLKAEAAKHPDPDEADDEDE